MLSPVEELIFFQRLPGVGASKYWKLMESFPSLHSALQASSDKLSRLLPKEAVAAIANFRVDESACPIVKQVKADVAFAEKHNIQILSSDHDAYPELLREIKKPPPILYVVGSLTALSLPQIALVGSRNPTPSGRSTAFDFSAELASAGFVITSGLALGVDASAHKGALSVNGRTIGVLGTGIDNAYPMRNRGLADEIIAKGGAIVSEFPLGTSALPANFPQRNRIISGLSYGTLVVEAAIKSGSLITAKYAVQQNRELFAIPGSIHNPLAKGCHALIKEGAKLVETSQDIVAELKGFLQYQWQQNSLALDEESKPVEVDSDLISSEFEGTLLKYLGYDPMPIDILVDRSQLPVGEVMACLLTMELKGLVANVGTGYMLVSSTSSGFGASAK